MTSLLHLEIGESSSQMQAFHWSKSIYHSICLRNTSLKVLTTSPGEMNLSEYAIVKRNMRQRIGKEEKGEGKLRRFWMQKRRGYKGVVVAAVAVAVAVTVSEYKKIGQGKETRQFREPMETRTDPRGYKEKELERKKPKLQQYTELIDVVERFHEIMKLIIEEEKKKPKVMLSGQYKEYPNEDGLAFFYPPMNYRPMPIPRSRDLNLSEEQWEQFDENKREGVVRICL
ncbi:MAG: hypothetical protein EZS28_046246 [Streblomastix strix]|uniref:Uncharacterized protein n=1 Tax=Streblomastix strix TaxID=222440 RepID=A0A5J4TIY8_9EUKA|nr:MAG: hypothetical protein EZS28_046246 [Streblomastix strix]